MKRLSTNQLESDLASRDRLLLTLERLLAIQATDLSAALTEASDLLAEAVGADKIDAFLYKPEIDSLEAVGVSRTEMSRRQVELGLNKIPLANGGREVEVFEVGQPYISGNADLDSGVLPGFRHQLGARSMVIVPLNVAGVRQGVIQAAAMRTEAFSRYDVLFLVAVAHWVGIVVQRAQLAERITQDTAEKVRRMAAEEMITLLAHDLNNHITPIQGRVERLRRRAEKDHREEDAADIQSLLVAVERLKGLVDDLLDIERIERGILVLDRKQVNLNELAEETAAAFSTKRAPVEVEVEAECDALNGRGTFVVLADAGRLRQALENLLSNATKHSPIGVPVAIVLKAETRASRRWAVIDVCDRGPGVAPEIVPRLFTRFGTASTTSGLGLGLFMARRIAEAHGGTLVYDPTYVDGADFRLSLPLE